MNAIRPLIALATLAAALGAQAQEATPMPQEAAVSGLSRQEVLAQTTTARLRGQLVAGNEGPATWAPAHGARSRDAVRHEAVAHNQRSSAQRNAERQIVGM
ncbi:MAG: hypothetical protein JNJ71_11725 [Rubrivivax sp.]|nr:hypothetical protein [Rubrivivax sp.]